MHSRFLRFFLLFVFSISLFAGAENEVDEEEAEQVVNQFPDAERQQIEGLKTFAEENTPKNHDLSDVAGDKKPLPSSTAAPEVDNKGNRQSMNPTFSENTPDALAAKDKKSLPSSAAAPEVDNKGNRQSVNPKFSENTQGAPTTTTVPTTKPKAQKTSDTGWFGWFDR
jgi:hypothetical protein